MCKDPPNGRLRRIAICACGAHFPECDIDDVFRHITSKSSPAHRWVWLDEEFFPMAPPVLEVDDVA